MFFYKTNNSVKIGLNYQSNDYRIILTTRQRYFLFKKYKQVLCSCYLTCIKRFLLQINFYKTRFNHSMISIFKLQKNSLVRQRKNGLPKQGKNLLH